MSIKHFKNLRAGLLSEILIEVLQADEKDIKNLLFLGAIYLNNERQIKDRLVSENNLFRVHTKPRRFNCDEDWKARIVFENDFFLVLNKPAGIPSHSLIDNIFENALTQTSLVRKYPLFITHRLDTLTSGLIVYAKKQKFVKDFNRQLAERSIKKKYVALLESSQIFPESLTHYMEPNSKTPKRISSVPIEGWDLCQLEIIQQKMISPQLSWIKINLLTGRTHQIRAQFSEMEAPIQGDTMYGSISQFRQNAIALRSCEIEFNCGDERMTFTLDENF